VKQATQVLNLLGEKPEAEPLVQEIKMDKRTLKDYLSNFKLGMEEEG